jgi:hypothetical protein
MEPVATSPTAPARALAVRALARVITLTPPALILGAAGLLNEVRRRLARRADGAPLANEAARVLAACRSTTYTYVPVVDPARGVYDLDCSAFVGLLLEIVAPALLARIPRAPGARYPRAFELYDFLASPEPGWSCVETLDAARRGDLICWRLPAIGSGDTGHVMVVADTPTFDGSLQTWSVSVYDASDIVHFDDSRMSAGTYHSGIGRGALRFRVDTEGRPVAFQFGPGDSFHTLPLLVARLDRQR